MTGTYFTRQVVLEESSTMERSRCEVINVENCLGDGLEKPPKMRKKRQITVQRQASLVIVLLLFSQISLAEPGREFLMSCTYGVLAGALVGAASLSIEENPGDKLHRVARGASLGLYTGILLGLYVVYLVPDSYGDPEDQDLEDVDPEDLVFHRQPKMPRMFFYPVVENNTVTGAGLQLSVLKF